MQKILIALVRGYRYAVSPLLGNHCRFHPSCSVYTETAIATHGTMRGAWLSVKRLARCHPWCAGGHDPVPPLGLRPVPADNSKNGKGRAASGDGMDAGGRATPGAVAGTAAEVRHG